MGKDYYDSLMAELQSKTIDALRFPLIVGVVFIHTDFSDIILDGQKQIDFGNFPVFSSIFFLFSKLIFEVCVPLFFFISGFLFFYKTEGFSRETYVQKLKNRVRSLLVPYIFWNFVVILFFFLAQTFLPEGMLSGRNKLIIDYSLSDWLWSFWDTSHINPHLEKTLPINSPFWFIRDLIVVVLCTPLLYWLLKKWGLYVVLAFGLLWVLYPYFYRPGLSTASFFFFTAGAYFSIHKINFVEMMKPLFFRLLPVYLLLAVAAFYLLGSIWWSYLYCAEVLLGLVLAVALTAGGIEKGKWQPNNFLTSGAFFIFAYHRLPLVFVIKFLFKLVRPQSDILLLVLYLAAPGLIIVLGLVGYSFLKQWMPRFMAAVGGDR
ncbi:acyltransferase family protein [Sphingobacterium thalpophilum]|uniref:Fucose 4-O-acetylase and related acetyltransferases n=1 Tax=Sphingobacterium thalpophilum TaxID=259 RepID=A0A4U9UL84_9SPHI|nr:acyltransferase [Sphingobacterium thalpophilum]VTR34176.1 Fucose 4-O-acetylase and related acetyltransferases [Sphingobacterium thalpophilum]